MTILALVILFAVYAFIAAGLQTMRAFTSARAGPVFGHLLLGLVDVAAGVVALVWPGPTALALVLVVAISAAAAGFAEIFSAFGTGETAGTRAMFILGGLVSVAFGVVLFARPDISRCCSGCSPSSTACLRSRRAFTCATPDGPCTQ